MHKIGNRTVERRYEIHLCLYQAVTGREEWKSMPLEAASQSAPIS